ncbi:MAG: tandem-95 repeat protein, partial [Pedobacter sp.]
INVVNPYNNVTVTQPIPVLYVHDNDIAKLSIISPAAVVEGHSGVKSLTFTLKLENTIDKGFSVQYATVDGSATEADKDYQKKTGTLDFSGFAGETKTVAVLVNGDTKSEGDEFFGLRAFGLLPDFDGKLVLDTNGRAVLLNDDISPLAADDFVTVTEDTPKTFSVIANDTHAEGVDPASVTITVLPEHGRIAIHQDGTVTYTPVLNYFGSDKFQYTVRDIFGRYSNDARVNITVSPVNDAPIANDDIFYVQRDSSIREKVAVNDLDVDGDVLSFNRISNTEHGSISFFDSSDGSFIYVPTQGFKGVDRFRYYIQDPEGLRDTADVTLYIQPKIRVDLTPNQGILVEGDSISITAKLTEFIYQDVNVMLNFSGTAIENKDYTLKGNYDVITIPARDTVTVHKFSIHNVKDYLKEGDETLEVRMTNVDPAAFVTIGDGADIILRDFYPGNQALDPEENGDINPDPYMSPNGDGLGNEKFVIYNIDRYPDNEVTIFNRWGNEVYFTKGYDNKDNAFFGVANKGMFAKGNNPLVNGVYYFIIKTTGNDGKIKRNKGYVIIRR